MIIIQEKIHERYRMFFFSFRKLKIHDATITRSTDFFAILLEFYIIFVKNFFNLFTFYLLL
jgi:hypothetical protein